MKPRQESHLIASTGFERRGARRSDCIFRLQDRVLLFN